MLRQRLKLTLNKKQRKKLETEAKGTEEANTKVREEVET